VWRVRQAIRDPGITALHQEQALDQDT